LAFSDEETDDFSLLVCNPCIASPIGYKLTQRLPRIRNPRRKTSLIDPVKCLEILGTESTQMHKNRSQELGVRSRDSASSTAAIDVGNMAAGFGDSADA
jgi:hypothetical protein